VGRRIRKVITNSGSLSGTIDFYLTGWREIEERDATDRLTQQYVYGIYIDEPLVMDRNLDGNNTATSTGDQRLFYHQNTLLSVFALTDTTGKIVEGYQYDAYGRQTVFGPGGNGVVNFGGDDVMTLDGISMMSNPYMYTGRRSDNESGLLYYRNRYGSTMLGRFVSRDPIGVWGDEKNLGNGYQLVGGNPSNFVDPLGLNGTRVREGTRAPLLPLSCEEAGTNKGRRSGMECVWVITWSSPWERSVQEYYTPETRRRYFRQQQTEDYWRIRNESKVYFKAEAGFAGTGVGYANEFKNDFGKRTTLVEGTSDFIDATVFAHMKEIVASRSVDVVEQCRILAWDCEGEIYPGPFFETGCEKRFSETRTWRERLGELIHVVWPDMPGYDVDLPIRWNRP
jgi:RHS repeat-associated protein